jgi:hypothetical protein
VVAVAGVKTVAMSPAECGNAVEALAALIAASWAQAA